MRHRKKSPLQQRLDALRARALELRSTVRTAALARTTGVRVVRDRVGERLAPRLRGRTRGAGLVAAGVLVAGFVASATTMTSADEAQTARAAVADANGRLAAAERADRSEREAPTTDASQNDASQNNAPPAPQADAQAPAAAVEPPPPPPPPTWANPIPAAAMSSCFGRRWGAMHQGLDFAAPAGTPILAAAAGTVVGSDWLYPGYGISIVIDHGNGFLTHYAHASQILVHAGDTVVAGQPIALEGSTGDSTGPHLHFEVHQGSLWNQIDPAQWLRERGIETGC